MVLRVGDSADGARVQFAPGDRGRTRGVSPIAGGRTLEVADGDALTPLIAFPYPDRALTSVAITNDGPDLLVRVAGPPIKDLTALPDAPRDPVLTWVRLRPRGSSWRIAIDGITTLSLPGATEGHAAADGAVDLACPYGTVAFTSNAKASRSSDDGALWTWTDEAAIEAHDPYPHTAMTLTPPAP